MLVAQWVLPLVRSSGPDRSSVRPPRSWGHLGAFQTRPESVLDEEYVAIMENLTERVDLVVSMFYEIGPAGFNATLVPRFARLISLIGLLHSSHATARRER